MWPWRVKMPIQNLLRLLLLLMRILSATICCRFRSWGLVKKLIFCSDFEHKVWSNFLSWSSDKIWSWSLTSFFCWCFVEVMLNPFWILVNYLKLGFVKILKLKFYGEADVWLRFWNWCFVEILKIALIKIFSRTWWTSIWHKQVTLVSWTQPSGLLCLWQCF